ncbi:MAG: ParB N-terminal domain-containing protein, partial [Bacillota bacterium]|nr:ParB N-terminal domain-containing protein [Bacillota bacterium]
MSLKPMTSNAPPDKPARQELVPAEIPIVDIDVDPELYPRRRRDDEVVAQQRVAVNRLPPIHVVPSPLGRYLLVDGGHRLAAHQLEGRTVIQAVVRTDLQTRRDILVEAIRLNAAHGAQLSGKDKERLARRLFGEYGVDALADLLSVSPRTVREWTRQERQLAEFGRDLKVLDLYLRGQPPAVVGEELSLPGSTVEQIVARHAPETGRISEIVRIATTQPGTDLEEAKQRLVHETLGEHFLDPTTPPPGFQEYSVWHFAGCDPKYGSDYPGRMAGQIVENLLWSYTPLFGHVYDPFAGGATTWDVCRAMFRRCWCSDIAPYAKDKVFQHDITTSYPRFPRGYRMDLVILDPPYWSQRKGEYGSEPTNFANMPLEAFYGEMEKVISGAVDVLADGGRLALLISSSLADGREYDHAFELYQRAGRHLQFERRFVIPYSKWQYEAHDVARARETGVRLVL